MNMRISIHQFNKKLYSLNNSGQEDDLDRDEEKKQVN